MYRNNKNRMLTGGDSIKLFWEEGWTKHFFLGGEPMILTKSLINFYHFFREEGETGGKFGGANPGAAIENAPECAIVKSK